MMDLEFTIRAEEAGQALRVDICQDRATVTGLASGRKIGFEGAFGDVTVKLLPAQDQDQPATTQTVSQEVSSVQAISPEVKADQPDPQLFARLAALRKQISSEVKLPPYIIFHDSALKEMCKRLPADVEALGAVPGVGRAKLEKYGARFLEVIREFTQGRSV